MLSLFAGLAAATIIFLVLIYFFFVTGIFGWSDGGDKEYLKKLELTTNIATILSVLVAIGTAIYIIYRMNRNAASHEK
jgi:hypothetical protein